jgi:uncharacterized membrane protein YcaP (DUF421 family)
MRAEAGACSRVLAIRRPLLPDWNGMFAPESLLEVFLRGTMMYLFIFFLLRVVRRETGTISVADVLVLVLIADAAQNAMAGEYRSVPEGMLLVATIVFWSLAMDWAGYRVEFIGRLLHPPAIEVVKDGKLLRDTMRRNFITIEELMTSVRTAGSEDLSRVQSAWLEGNGEISVILKQG